MKRGLISTLKNKGLGLLSFSIFFFITCTVYFSLKNWKFGSEEKNSISSNEEGLVQQFAKKDGSSNEIALTCAVLKKLVEIRKADSVEETIRETDWTNLLGPEAMCNKDKILAAQSTMQELQSSIEDEILKIQNNYNGIVEFIKSYHANEEFKAGFIESFESRWKQNEGLLLEFYQVKKDVISLNKAMLEFFYSIEGKVECVNKKLVFERDEDLEKLKSFKIESEELAKQEDSIDKKMEEAFASIPAWQQAFASEKTP